jgi:hypothetical protein
MRLPPGNSNSMATFPMAPLQNGLQGAGVDGSHVYLHATLKCSSSLKQQLGPQGAKLSGDPPATALASPTYTAVQEMPHTPAVRSSQPPTRPQYTQTCVEYTQRMPICTCWHPAGSTHLFKHATSTPNSQTQLYDTASYHLSLLVQCTANLLRWSREVSTSHHPQVHTSTLLVHTHACQLGASIWSQHSCELHPC